MGQGVCTAHILRPNTSSIAVVLTVNESQTLHEPLSFI